jgi:uncharacterized protein YqgC (DUF456 family)
MDSANIQSKPTSRNYVMPLIVALLVTQFLFFIDEGYYDFRWMKSIGNWIVYIIYTAFLFGGQMLIRRLFFRRSGGKGFTVLVSISGVIVGLAFALLVFSKAWDY